MDDFGVIVGTGIGGQRNILEALRQEGVKVKSAGNRMWPRDHYVYFQGKYVISGSPGSIDGNAFGEGGNVLPGENFVLVSDMIYVRKQIKRRLSQDPTYQQILEAILEEGKIHYPRVRVHVSPTGYFHEGKGHEHIDMFSLLLPKKKILLLDTYYGKGASKAQEYDIIAEREGLRLLRYDGSQDGVWCPLNALVIPSQTGETDCVMVDSKSKSLLALLSDEGAQVVEAEMPQHPFPSGKINCQTNIYNPKDNPEDLMGKV